MVDPEIARHIFPHHLRNRNDYWALRPSERCGLDPGPGVILWRSPECQRLEKAKDRVPDSLQLANIAKVVDPSVALVHIHLQGVTKAKDYVKVLPGNHSPVVQREGHYPDGWRHPFGQPRDRMKYGPGWFTIPRVTVQVNFESFAYQSRGQVRSVGFGSARVAAEIFNGQSNFHGRRAFAGHE